MPLPRVRALRNASPTRTSSTACFSEMKRSRDALQRWLLSIPTRSKIGCVVFFHVVTYCRFGAALYPILMHAFDILYPCLQYNFTIQLFDTPLHYYFSLHGVCWIGDTFQTLLGPDQNIQRARSMPLHCPAQAKEKNLSHSPAHSTTLTKNHHGSGPPSLIFPMYHIEYMLKISKSAHTRFCSVSSF
jgi:hypothetical protein